MSSLIDDISRVIASPISRRHALKLVSGAVGGAVLGSLGLGRAAQAQQTNQPCRGDEFACGKAACCKHDQMCCGFCWGASLKDRYHCCGDRLCSRDSVCCANKCCERGEACCGSKCCPPHSACCGTTCCPSGYYCCGGNCLQTRPSGSTPCMRV